MQLENMLSLAEENPETVLPEAESLAAKITDDLIRQFGNGKVANLEIFIRPL